MNLLKKINLIVVILVFMVPSNIFAQTWEEREEQRKSKKVSFWEWLFGDFFTDTADEPIHIKDVYDGLTLKVNFSRQWKFSVGDNGRWTSLNYDDQAWEYIKVPADWENDGFNGYDGFAWYRIHFNGKDLNKNQSHFLILGDIDDVDETFINGNLIGKSGQFPPRFRTAYNHDRKYSIPIENINFEGDNVIAVRVYDHGLNGGIVNGRPGIYATTGSEKLLQDLYGQWRFTKENYDLFSQANYDDEDWAAILVPSFWDNQGYRSLDGIAWYRKHFKLNFTPKQGKEYYLVLGNIDDFDITFLNGKEIGRTDDGRAYGQSESYQQIRVYKIPQWLLKTNGDNVIAVKVYDIGNEGGIYKGPIGIIDEASVTKMIRK